METGSVDRWRPRWRWTGPLLGAGIVLVAVGLIFKESTTGVYLELLGFLVLVVTLGGFLMVGPAPVDDL